MSKPFAGSAGSGMHTHISLLLAQRRRKRVRRRLRSSRHLQRLPAASSPASWRHAAGVYALLAPTVNCLKRRRTHTFSPTNVSWGLEDRSALVRIKGGSAASRHIENRAPTSLSNPYLVAAGLLAAGLDGIERGLRAGAGRPAARPRRIPVSDAAADLGARVAGRRWRPTRRWSRGWARTSSPPTAPSAATSCALRRPRDRLGTGGVRRDLLGDGRPACGSASSSPASTTACSRDTGRAMVELLERLGHEVEFRRSRPAAARSTATRGYCAGGAGAGRPLRPRVRRAPRRSSPRPPRAPAASSSTARTGQPRARAERSS